MLNKLMFMGVTGITYTANVISYTEEMYIEEAGITLTLPAYKTENITPTTFNDGIINTIYSGVYGNSIYFSSTPNKEPSILILNGISYLLTKITSGWYSSATTLPLSSYVNQTITFTLE